MILRIIKFLFPAVFPLYGGGGGGGGKESKTTNTVKKNDPWAPAQPYIKEGYSEAQRLYNQGPQKYTPWSQVAEFDPQQLAAMNGIRDYINSSGTQAQLAGANGVVSNLLAGGNNVQGNLGKQYEGNLAGYLQNNRQADTSDALNRFMYQNTSDPSLMANVGNAVTQAHTSFDPAKLGIQTRFGVGEGVLKGLNDTNRQNTINAMMSSGWNSQEGKRQAAINTANQMRGNQAGTIADLISKGDSYSQQARALGLQYQPQLAQLPLQYLGVLNDIGGKQQAQNQAQLNDATNRWNFDQNAAYENLVRYRNMVNPNSAWGTSAETTSGTTALAGMPKPNTAVSVGGGALSGAAAGAAIGNVPGAIIGGILGAGLGYAGSR